MKKLQQRGEMLCLRPQETVSGPELAIGSSLFNKASLWRHWTDSQRDAKNTAPALGFHYNLCILSLSWQRQLIWALTSLLIPYSFSRSEPCRVCTTQKEEISNVTLLRLLWSLRQLTCEQKWATNKLQQPLRLGQATAGTVPPLTAAGFKGGSGLNSQTMLPPWAKNIMVTANLSRMLNKLMQTLTQWCAVCSSSGVMQDANFYSESRSRDLKLGLTPLSHHPSQKAQMGAADTPTPPIFM